MNSITYQFKPNVSDEQLILLVLVECKQGRLVWRKGNRRKMKRLEVS